MSENNKKLKSLDEIVFEGRNKAYGAYDMRMSENSTLLKAFLRGFVVIVILAFAVFASATGMFKAKESKDVVVDVQLEDLTLPEPEPEEEEVVEPEPEPEQQENHYQEETAQEKFVMPEPKEQPKKEETIPPKEELVGKDLSFEKREGTESKGQTGGGPVNLNKEAPKNTTQAPKTEDKGTTAGPATVTARTAAVMAVYPGCEKDAAKGKQQATDCLSRKLGADIGDELQDFANDAAGEGLSGVIVAKLSFQIDTNGRIVSINPQGDAKLGPEARKALQRITERQQKRGKTIVPAQTEDGRPAKLNFSIPVKMAIE
ncbi:protein TonB [Chishuiella changwenlii]|uniref:Protein TonB n=1 Tax=Chishuiella changwenlii TaxID=1434701 RepID=A0A1M6WH11_9FLAO|nr:hypothetical protein [Chishuiella changwenlii]GGF04881.1 hypothetical protein GCM10010984_22670 [Chishuiella changwenlii]SHK92939.1 protein TonB [Chishuiella changwenlii]